MNVDIKKLLDYLNEYCCSNSRGLGKLGFCAYFGVLKSLNQDQLEEAAELISQGDYCHELIYVVKECLDPKPEPSHFKNESIGTLIARFRDRKSRRVGESRKALICRFPYQNYSDQKKILKAFLESNVASDLDWAAVQADKIWDNSYVDYVAAAYDRKDTDKLALLVIRHMPADYVKAREASLVMHSRAEFCIRFPQDADGLAQKYDLSMFEYLYVKAKTHLAPDISSEEVELYFFRHIFVFAQHVLQNTYYYLNLIYLSQMPWLGRALWALGELGYPDVLMRFLELSRYVEDKCSGQEDENEYYYCQEWIADKYYPSVKPVESFDSDKVLDPIERLERPQSIRIDSVSELAGIDGMSQDIIDTVSDFM